MTLKEQLATLKAQNLAKFPKEIKDTILGDLQRLSESGIVDTDGTIAYAFVAADYTLRAEPTDEVFKKFTWQK